ncbi:MAG: hypothetical protein HZA52_18585 [Planctomycetes bacterium]|nr:hypothetical protein [Planctomycetota bacterium]
MDEPATPQPPVTPAATLTKHSGFGIASFVLSLLGCTGMAFTFAACLLVLALRRDALHGKGTAMAAIGFVMIGMVVLELVALVFGVLGSLDRTRRRGLAIAGVVVAGLTLFVCAALIALGKAS